MREQYPILQYLLVIFFLLFTSIIANAQTFSDDNFLYTVAPKIAVKEADLSSLTKEEVTQSVAYFDGLGRPVQTIAIGQGGSGSDIITPIEYDSFGRQVKEHLPYTSFNGGNSYPKIDPISAINAVFGFYNTEQYQNTSNPYSQKEFESSPLKRVLKQAAPGNDWAIGSGHEIKLQYETNTASEVKLYKATAIWNSGAGLYEIALTNASDYAANQLYKNIIYDENSGANSSESAGSTVEFKNKEGQVVLKRTYDGGEKHDTYYVYDVYGNLTYVLPPKSEGAITSDVLNGLCYQYKYDYRNRLVEKKLPGKQWEFIVYDNLDRPVATGPALSPFKDDTSIGWLITKYDAFSRTIYTGWSNATCSSAARSSMQVAQNNAAKIFETKETSGDIDGIAAYYTNTISPISFSLLTVTYYDNYIFPSVAAVPTTIEGQSVLSNTKGLPTGSWIRTVTTAAEKLGETSTSFYDDKGRAISSYSKNYLGGYVQVDSKLDFIGKTDYTITKQKRISGDNVLTIREDFTYSAQDRLIKHTHQINGGTAEVLAENTYDSLGQLVSKNIGNTSANPLQKIDYTYNIRGWLIEINKKNNLQIGTDPADLFAFKLNYNSVENASSGAVALYNGNISETIWKTGTDITEKAYGYQYDKLNRLKNATYLTPALTDNKNYFGESMNYDKNGNILHLKRNNIAGTSNDPYVGGMDDLTYDYKDGNSNLLIRVTEGLEGNLSEGFIDGNRIDDDYDYDANGNLIIDKNKNITEIQYNHLNLPKKIVFGVQGSIDYIYSASGEKLKKIVNDGETSVATDYLKGFQYKDTVLEFFPTAEGYVNNNAGSLSYVYQYKDHLGNIRVSYRKNSTTYVLEIIDETNYYPFGLKHTDFSASASVNSNKYKFQGQERQDELGLNWDSFKWRNYDPAIGRFMSIDPLAPDFPQWSPYVFSGNLVTISKELEGMEPEFLVQKDGKLTSGVVTLMHAAYGYSVSSLQNSTWIISTDARVSNWDKLTGHPEASVKGSQVMYSNSVKNRGGNYWLGLIGHEQSHRTEVENEGLLSFYSKYIMQGATRDYEKIDTEATAFNMGSSKGMDLTDKLLSYKNGAVMDIFNRGNLTNNEKASMLETVGNQFKRDVTLQGSIDGAQQGLQNLKDIKVDDKTRASMTSLLNGLIKNWTNEQNEITKKYGR